MYFVEHVIVEISHVTRISWVERGGKVGRRVSPVTISAHGRVTVGHSRSALTNWTSVAAFTGHVHGPRLLLFIVRLNDIIVHRNCITIDLNYITERLNYITVCLNYISDNNTYYLYTDLSVYVVFNLVQFTYSKLNLYIKNRTNDNCSKCSPMSLIIQNIDTIKSIFKCVNT